MGFEQPFSTDGHAGKADSLVEKRPHFYQNQMRENLQILYIMNNLVCWPFKISSDY